MKNAFKLFGITAAIAVIGLSLAGCGGMPVLAPAPPTDPALELRFGSGRVGWSAHPPIHASKYEVVGSVAIRNVNQATLVADLMSHAIAMGGHDIINVRIDTITAGRGRNKRTIVSSASAVVIRYVGILRSIEGAWQE